MSAYKAAYRMRMYAPRSVDPNEATILTPVAGAPHSDPFQVASIQGVSGYQPYLGDVPKGRRGRIDLRSRKLDTGSFTFTLVDKKLAGTTGNASRWFTAFVGNLKGETRGRVRVEVEESLDGGVTWGWFTVGELIRTRMRKNEVELTVRDRTETLKMKAFVGRPHSSITYASTPTLLPVGFMGASYGPIASRVALKAKVNPPGTFQPTESRYVMLDGATAFAPDVGNIRTKELTAALAPHQLISSDILVNPTSGGVMNEGVGPDFSGRLRCHLKRLDTQAEGDFKVGAVIVWNVGVHSFWIAPLASNEPGYLALPPAATDVEIYLYVDNEVSEDWPLLVADVDPATFIIDLCAGKFSHLYQTPETLPTGKAFGDAKRSVPTNGVSSLVDTRPPGRWFIRESEEAISVIESVCLENNWAPWLDDQGRLNVVNLDLPTTLAGVPTITDDDVVEDQSGEWEDDPTSAISRVDFTWYTDDPKLPQELLKEAAEAQKLGTAGDKAPSFNAGMEETEHPKSVLYAAALDYGEENIEIDARSYRSVDGEVYQGQIRSRYLEGRLDALAQAMRRPYERGAQVLPLICRRTATINALVQGQVVIVDVDWVVDPYTHLRGGGRVCRILEISKEGLAIRLELLDLGLASQATAPTIGQPSQMTGNTYTGVSVAVTRNAASQPVELQWAATETSVAAIGNVPDLAWVGFGRLIAANETVNIENVPPGKRIWVRGRTFPTPDPTFPSAWANHATPYVDTAALPTPSAPANPSKTHKTATISWTNGSANLQVEVLLATPTTDPRVRDVLLPPGTTSHEITRLLPNTTYRIEVRHRLGQFPGSGVTIDVTTNAGGGACTAVAGFAILT